MKLYLEFAQQQGAIERVRLNYALAVFCAVYGHSICEEKERYAAEMVLSYSDRRAPRAVHLSLLYRVRPLHQPAPAPGIYTEDGERTVLILGSATAGRKPDWLGEIFEWISCADEYSVPENEVGSPVPFAASYHGRHRLDPYVPYAAVAMRLLQREICRQVPLLSDDAVSFEPAVRHYVVNTHDIDLLPMSTTSSLKRLLKNVAISTLVYRMPRLSAKQIELAIRLLTGGQDPIDQLWTLADGEINRSLEATYFFLCERRHRRDGNYTAHDLQALTEMKRLQAAGMEIGVHGSYLSLSDPSSLDAEHATLADQGVLARGNRQHWLRFRPDRLIEELEHIGVAYDSSFAWHETIGFRAGACFPFPPYNFRRERAATFLEIPVAVMDVGLIRAGIPMSEYMRSVSKVLSASRRYGWGGVAVLWHQTAFGQCQMPKELGSLFWALLDQAELYEESWVSAKRLMEILRSRYSTLGLLLPAQDRYEAGVLRQELPC